MKKRILLAAAVAAFSFAASAADGELVPANWKTRGFCVGAPATADVPRFCAFVTNTLAHACAGDGASAVLYNGIALR